MASLEGSTQIYRHKEVLVNNTQDNKGRKSIRTNTGGNTFQKYKWTQAASSKNNPQKLRTIHESIPQPWIMTIFCTPHQSDHHSCTLPPQKSSTRHTLCMFKVLLLSHKSIKNLLISKLTQLLHHQLITLMSSSSPLWSELSPGTGLTKPKHSRDYPTFPIHQTKCLKKSVFLGILLSVPTLISSFQKYLEKCIKSIDSLKLLQTSDLI